MEESAQNKGHQSDANDAEEHLDEHNYDGIQELDNPPPRWIMAIFYLTIGFSIIYAAYFFWLDVGDDQDAEYARKSEMHDAQYQLTGESAEEIVVLSDAADLEEGKAIYAAMNCAVCHGAKLEGNPIGPNLTDNAWINGCDFQSVFNVIKNGVPAKGMTPFKSQLSDNKIQKVTSYVLNMVGSNPDKAKGPQGEACE